MRKATDPTYAVAYGVAVAICLILAVSWAWVGKGGYALANVGVAGVLVAGMARRVL